MVEKSKKLHLLMLGRVLDIPLWSLQFSLELLKLSGISKSNSEQMMQGKHEGNPFSFTQSKKQINCWKKKISLKYSLLNL